MKKNIQKKRKKKKKKENKEIINIENLMNNKDLEQYYNIKNKINEYEKLLNKIDLKDFDETIIKNKIGVIYNYYPGEIFIFLFDSKEKPIVELRKTNIKSSILPYKLDNSELTAVLIDKYFLFGTKLGSIMLYRQGRNSLEKIIHYHTQKILYIDQNFNLHLMISSSEDGYINIYTTPNAILIRSIYLDNFLGDYVLLSYSPLPSFIIYNKEKECFKSYSINGRNLLKENKKIKNVNNVKIEKTEYFIEYLKINENSLNIFNLPNIIKNKEIENTNRK